MTSVMPTLEAFASYINVDATDEPSLVGTLAIGGSLVDGFLESAYREVPQDVYTQVVLEVAQNVYKRRENSPSATTQFASVTGVETTSYDRDPMRSVMPILRRYVLSL